MKWMMSCGLAAALFVGGGCATSRPSARLHPEAVNATRDNAYSLLYDLLGDEKDVSKVLVVKHNSRELGDFIKEVSAASGKATTELKAFGEQDRALILTAKNLPPGEEAARKGIATTKKKDLLTNSNDNFELALLLTQTEALSYMSHLAAVAAAHDADPKRAAWARALDRQMKELYARCVDLMIRKPHGKQDKQSTQVAPGSVREI